ncbi:MAG: hypothetical protein H6Q68_2910 [Firmicutes bacterium]|nr:hypothetical protein [Bacillota bacterium]
MIAHHVAKKILDTPAAILALTNLAVVSDDFLSAECRVYKNWLPQLK